MSGRKGVLGRDDKIFILPTGHGLLFMAGVVVMILTGATYGNNLIYMLAFILFSIVMIGMVQTHNNLRRVDVQVSDIEDGFSGEWSRLVLVLSHKLKVERQNLSVRLEKNADLISTPSTLDVLPEQGMGRVELTVMGKHRGVYSLPRLVVETKFPMGLFKAWKYKSVAADVYIYPALTGIRRLPREDLLFGERKKVQGRSDQSHETDFKEHRDYREGESHRRIDWKIVARRGTYLTKTFEGEAGGVFRLSFFKIGARSTEDKLSQLAVWIQEAYHQKAAFELELPDKKIAASKSSQHYKNSLRELARYET